MGIKKLINRGFDYTIYPILSSLNRLKLKEKDNILVISSPRGGSTWLSDILANLPRSVTLLEPFTKGNIKELENIKFEWVQHIPEDATWPEAHEIFTKLFDHEIIRSTIINKYNFPKLFRAKTYIYKIVNGHLFLPWVVQNFNVKVVFMVRHPCAVVSSQLSSGGWQTAKKDHTYKYSGFRYDEFYQPYIKQLLNISSTEENLASTWALMNNYLVNHPANNHKWLTISYEYLYLHPEKELKRIFDFLGKEIPTKSMREIKRTSLTAKGEASKLITTGKQLEMWKHRLTHDQQKLILNQVKSLGTDYYDDSLMPNLEALYRGKYDL